MRVVWIFGFCLIAPLLLRQQSFRRSYDYIGNMTNYGDVELAWQGTQLVEYVDAQGNQTLYTYDENGMRTSKIKGNWVQTYSYDGNKVMRILTSQGNKILTDVRLYYDVQGRPSGMRIFSMNSAGTAVSQDYTYFFITNIFGDVTEILDDDGNILVEYFYDPFGNAQTVDKGSNTKSSLAINNNPFQYRGYFYDSESGFYYLNSRYYSPELGRFISMDNVKYLTADGTMTNCNLYTYCDNNPIMRHDQNGHAWDTVLDVVFLGWDIYDLCTGEGWKDWGNWGSLALDLVFAAIPFIPNMGGSQVVKLANVADDLNDMSKITVVGETMGRVTEVAKSYNAVNNLYEGFKAYEKLSELGKGGKVLAELGGKASNIAWLYGKLRSGYTVINIGIDVGRTVRSSSYFVERIVLTTWKTRNIWKLSYHM